MATKSTNKKPSAKSTSENRGWFIVAYFLSLVTGIVVLFLKGEEDKRLKLHAMQAIFLGILMIIVYVIFTVLSFGLFFFGFLGGLLNLFIWLYGLYVGFEAYNGKDITIPVITDYATKYSK